MKTTSFSRRTLATAVAALGSLALGATARADKILIDFGSTASFRGVSVPNPDGNGNFWNSNQPGTLMASLVNTANAPSGLALGWDTPVATDSFNGPAGATTFPNPTATDLANAAAAFSPADKATLGDLYAPEAVIDFAASPALPDNSTILDIEHLDPSKTYTFKLFGSHIFSTNQQTQYSVYQNFDSSHVNDPANGLSGLQGTAAIDVQELNQADQTHPPNVPNTSQVATLSGLVPNSNGTLYVDFIGVGGNLGYLNDMEIISGTAPEPTMIAACAMTLGLAALRRHRRA